MYLLGFILCLISLVQAKKGPCFEFPGESFLEFKPNNFDISQDVHYNLKLQTRASEGVVMYAEGPEDYEALFLSQGKLVYLLTNPSPSGVEGTTGGYYVSNQEVNNGTWLEVDVWRNWEANQPYQKKKTLMTGLTIKDTSTGVVETHLDEIKHRGVRMNPTVYFGGVAPYVIHTNRTVSPDLVGEIKEIHEAHNGVDFEIYSLNFDGKVYPCS
ncbi:uncharacterized protein LOC143279517 [Babylonia areolata]|uniref:uncharacterized protein LOC143279517 n=1 Tax=Babylonia areolata TaxID=304850 RepID=UPI003FD2CEDB